MKKEAKADEITQLRGGEIRQDKTRTEECKGEIYQILQKKPLNIRLFCNAIKWYKSFLIGNLQTLHTFWGMYKFQKTVVESCTDSNFCEEAEEKERG